jgi:hypothetical protein
VNLGRQVETLDYRHATICSIHLTSSKHWIRLEEIVVQVTPLAQGDHQRQQYGKLMFNYYYR